LPAPEVVEAEPLLSLLMLPDVPALPLAEPVPLSDELFERLDGELPLAPELVLCVALVDEVLLLFLFLCRSPMASA
jgi:hypothetical protein